MEYAYIFDVDGVLIDTMEVHFQCYKQALHEVNVPIDKAQFFRQAGMTGREQIRYFAGKAGLLIDVEQVYQRKRQLFEVYPGNFTVIECNVGLLRVLRASGIPIALASGSSKRSWLGIVKKFGIPADAMVGAEDVQKGKPNPDLFLCAAERLGVPPSECIVIEDSDAGIEAAKAAGMKALRFYNNRLQSCSFIDNK